MFIQTFDIPDISNDKYIESRSSLEGKSSAEKYSSSKYRVSKKSMGRKTIKEKRIRYMIKKVNVISWIDKCEKK